MNYKLYAITTLLLFIPSCMFRDKKDTKHTYFIQAPLDLEVIKKMQITMGPVIDAILQEELGVAKNEQYPTFFFKRRQAITIYYVNDYSYYFWPSR